MTTTASHRNATEKLPCTIPTWFSILSKTIFCAADVGTENDRKQLRIDYEKGRMLIRKDILLFNPSIYNFCVSQGYITGELKDSFPAANIVDPDNFISLLYYFGMLTISGMHKGKNKLTIPNQVVEEQLYTYLLNTYNEADLSFNSYEKETGLGFGIRW